MFFSPVVVFLMPTLIWALEVDWVFWTPCLQSTAALSDSKGKVLLKNICTSI